MYIGMVKNDLECLNIIKKVLFSSSIVLVRGSRTKMVAIEPDQLMYLGKNNYPIPKNIQL